MQRIIDTEDGAGIIKEFKQIILLAYGKRSADGKRFIKNQTMRDEFESSEAYSTLFVELCTNADAAVEFMNGIIPEGLAEDVEKIETRQSLTLAVTQEPNSMSLADFVKVPMEEIPALQARIASGDLKILQ